MATPVTMPRLGESVSEGTIGAWLKQEGDYVGKDESLAEVITDKINAELPSPVAGRLVKILVQVDETVGVGSEIALIEESDDGATSPPPTPLTAAVSVPGPDAAPVQGTRQAAIPVHAQQSAGAPRANGAGSVGTATAYAVPQSEEERQRVSPLAKRLAREYDLDLSQIPGTGTGGRVRKEDILAYVEQQATPASLPASAAFTSSQSPSLVPPGAPSVAASAIGGPDEEILIPSRMRMAIAEHMVRSKRTSPHASTMVEIDMTNIAKWLEKHKDEFKRREGYSISYVPFVMKAVCEGIRKVPLINSTWTEDNKIIIKKRINLGMAVATDDGLVVPTIYDADQYTLAGLAKQVAALAQRARTNKLTVQDMQNSTFVVNNPGVFGTIISIPIINQPHAAILSMDAVVKRPVVIEDDAIAVRSMMFLSISIDHRILDGASAGAFLQVVRSRLQSYGREIDVY